jgi:hypothetical protein
MSESEKERNGALLSSVSQGDWAEAVDDSRVEMRFRAEESTENKSSSVRFIRTRAEESSDFVEERSPSVLVTRTSAEDRAEESSDFVKLSSDLVKERSDCVEEISDLVEESSVKLMMETNPP